MQFYTNFFQKGDHVYIRGFDKNGNRFQDKVKYKPTLYVPSREPTEYKELYGSYVAPINFDTITDARDFIDQNSGMSNFKIYGNSGWEYAYVSENYRSDITCSLDDLNLMIIDIETTVNLGFPDVKNPEEAIILVTFRDWKTKQKITFGLKEYTGSEDVNFVLCRDEKDLLKKLIQYIRVSDIDIISGWNCDFFDIAYTCARIKKILGEADMKQLSPWNMVNKRTTTIMDREFEFYEIRGLVVLDLLDLYKKFTYVKQESYKLDQIGDVELGMKKLENPFDTFKEFYEKDWNLFVEYNIRDTDIVFGLEEKMGLISLAVNMAHETRINFDDVFSPVKTWEYHIFHSLAQDKVFVELKDMSGVEDSSIVGGFVLAPKPGMYEWVVTADAASLYPSILIGLNMSPETILDHYEDCMIDNMLTQRHTFDKSKQIAYAANGTCYDTSFEVVMPRLSQKMFDNRKLAKKKMKEAEQLMEDVKAELKSRGETV